MMMNRYDSIVNPIRGKGSPRLGPIAVMVAGQGDLNLLCSLMGLGHDNSRRLFASRLFTGTTDGAGDFSVLGPFIGAPYAAMLLETLIAWGARKIIFFGWCGAVSPQVKIGDVIVPTAALVDDGTSPHYGMDRNSMPKPSDTLLAKTRNVLREQGRCFHEGLVWSTDAIYMETREKVMHYQRKDVLAVEMEMSAFFTVGKYRQVDVGGILVVSDEVSAFKWRTGFKDRVFKKSRQQVAGVIRYLLPGL